MESNSIHTRPSGPARISRGTVIYIICLMCLVLFAMSAFDKIIDHERFAGGLTKVKYLSEYALLISWAVPAAEILVCLFLVYPPTQRLGLYGFVGLMMVFTVYILSMLLWAEKLPCHCNLIIEKLSWREHVWFNLGFIGLSLCALWLGRAKTNIKN